MRIVLRPAYNIHEWINRIIKTMFGITITTVCEGRSQWPLDIRSRSAIVRLLRLWARIQREEWTFVCWVCCVLSGRGLCDELIPRPEKSHRMCCVVVCDLTISWMRRSWPTGGGWVDGVGSNAPKTNTVRRQQQAICKFNNWPSYQGTFYKSRKCYYIKHLIL